MASKAIPSHLRPSAASNGSNGGSAPAGAEKRHHGKTQSHVVSNIQNMFQSHLPNLLPTFPTWPGLRDWPGINIDSVRRGLTRRTDLTPSSNILIICAWMSSRQLVADLGHSILVLVLEPSNP